MAWAGKCLLATGALLFLFHAANNLHKVQQLERLSVYDLGTFVEAETVGQMLEQDISDQVIFFTELKDQSLENAAWFRQVDTDVVEICGDSTLLFRFGYPLEPEDKNGCLIGEETAFKLYGGTQIIGEQVIYEGQVYEIRGVLQGERVFVIQARVNTLLKNAGILGNSVLERSRTAEKLQNTYWLNLNEIPLWFYEKMIRLEIFAATAFLYIMAGWHLCHRFSEKKAVKKSVIWIGILCVLMGIVFVLSITTYNMPDKLSDLSWWGDYFCGEWEAWKEFVGREEMFLQKAFRECVF